MNQHLQDNPARTFESFILRVWFYPTLLLNVRRNKAMKLSGERMQLSKYWVPNMPILLVNCRISSFFLSCPIDIFLPCLHFYFVNVTFLLFALVLAGILQISKGKGVLILIVISSVPSYVTHSYVWLSTATHKQTTRVKEAAGQNSGSMVVPKWTVAWRRLTRDFCLCFELVIAGVQPDGCRRRGLKNCESNTERPNFSRKHTLDFIQDWFIFLIIAIYNRCLGRITDDALWIWVGQDFTWNARAAAAVGGARLWTLQEDRESDSSKKNCREKQIVLAEPENKNDSLPVALFLKRNRGWEKKC